MANNIFVIDDGTRELTIQNPLGEVICTIHVRTSDISIVDRYDDFIKEFDNITNPIRNVRMKIDGTSSFDEDWKVIKSVERDLINRLNIIFDSNDIEKLFEKRNAFSMIDGVFYIEKVIEMFQKVISETLAEETMKSKERVDKYTKDIHRKESMNK